VARREERLRPINHGGDPAGFVAGEVFVEGLAVLRAKLAGDETLGANAAGDHAVPGFP